jgi:subtilisin family serine protease
MGRGVAALALGLAVAAAWAAAPAPAAPPPRDATTILVKFAAGHEADKAKVSAKGDAVAGETKTKTLVVKLHPGASVDEKLAEYQARDDVLYAEANITASAALAAPNDPSYGAQWGLAKTNALGAWSVFPGSYTVAAGPAIAVVDSGVDSSHPDLVGRVQTASGANCLSGVCVADPAADDYGHGTHVAGIAAAWANNLAGGAGVAYGAPVIPVKVLDSTGNGSAAGLANGIIWAADSGAPVINVSLGSTAYSRTVCDAVTYATSHGALVIAAAGNNGSSVPYYPAACPGAVGVGATDSSDAVASFSDTGSPNVALTAPGVDILSTYPGGGYQTASGTSMAAPFVSGVAELVLAQTPSRTAAEVKRILAASAVKAGTVAYGADPYALCAGCTWNASYGYGRVDAARALTTAPPAPAPDFTLAPAGQTATVAALKATDAIAVNGLSGFAGTVSFSVTGLPSGATAAFSPTTVTGSASTTLTVTTSSTTPPGSYPLAVKGTSGVLTRTAAVTLLVPGPDFALKLSSASASVYQGDKPAFSVSLDNQNGFKGTVSLAASGLPTGTTAAFSRTSTSGTTAVTLTLATTTSTPAGTYAITVTGTSGSLVHTAPLTLTVAVPVPTFTLALSTTASSIPYGKSTSISYKLTITPKFGFKGPVSLSVDGVPAGTSGAFTATTVSVTPTSAGYGAYKLTIPAGAPRGTSTLTFTASGGGVTTTAPATVTIT